LKTDYSHFHEIKCATTTTTQEISKQNSSHSKKGKDPMMPTNPYYMPGPRQLSLQHNVQPLSEKASMNEKSQQNQTPLSRLSSITKNKSFFNILKLHLFNMRNA